ncbi:alpha/beta fold hydrolase [Rhizobiaceae bacterium]|nr:alpha/beta fold hydrolase [Rhizobiaceae bacterium]
MKRPLAVTLLILATLAVVFAFGPREPVDETITFDAATLGDDLDAYLAAREAPLSALKPGAEKRIVWNNPAARNRTPLSIVYLHGFSATSQEVRPLPDLVARTLGANLFYARLTGHGQGGPAMATASANAWYNDVAEALAIARSIGDRVVLLSTSTGGTLATWAVTQQELAADVIGTAMISPNFAVQAAGADALLLPWARQLVPLVFGANRSFQPLNDGQAQWWTTSYPNLALLPMQATVAHTARLPFEAIEVPALFIFHPEDQVVRSDVTEAVAARWGANTSGDATILRVESSGDPSNHVIAGDIMSPDTTAPLATAISDWIKPL